MKRVLFFSPIPLLLIVLLYVCLSYGNTLYSPAVLDDYSGFIGLKKIYVTDISIESLQRIADTRFGIARLVPLITFSLSHYFFSGDVIYYHLVNIVIHLMATCALFFFIKGLLQSPQGGKSLYFIDSAGWFSLFVCALWALSPLQTNAVTYLVQRMTALCGLFYLASLAFYVYGRNANGTSRIILFILSMFTAALAFLSKENSFTLPLAILMVECMFFSPGKAIALLKSVRWQYWLLVLILVIILLPLLSHPWQVMVMDSYSMRHFNLSERLLTELRVVVFYISLLVLPLPGRLNLDHAFSVSSSLFTPPTTFLSLLLLIFLFGGAIIIRKRSPIIALGIFWFFLNLAIESTFVPLELIFEHRLYLPSAGFFIALVGIVDWGAYRLTPAGSPDAKKVLFLFAIILFSISSLLTTLRNDAWQDNLTLYKDCAIKSPDKVRPLSNYGFALAVQEKYEEALSYMNRAMELGQPQDEYYINTAANIIKIYVNQEKYDEAIEKGEEFFDNFSLSMNMANFNNFTLNLGGTYVIEKRFKEGFNMLMTGLRFFPEDTQLQKALLVCLNSANITEEGREELGLNGETSEIFLLMTAIMVKIRQYDQALIFLKNAELINPDDPQLQNYKKKLDETIEKNQLIRDRLDISNDTAMQENLPLKLYFSLATFIDNYYPPLQGAPLGWLLSEAEARAPDNPHVGFLAAQHLLRAGRIEEVIKKLDHVIENHPYYTPAMDKLATLYMKGGAIGRAAETAQNILDQYPANPSWKTYEDIISGYKEKNDIRLMPDIHE